MATAQERYYEMLMERVRTDRYPSPQLLDRIEATFWTGEQLVQYIDMLLEKADEAWYPSNGLLDRIQRLMLLTAAATGQA
jgi:hypothetical protein